MVKTQHHGRALRQQRQTSDWIRFQDRDLLAYHDSAPVSCPARWGRQRLHFSTRPVVRSYWCCAACIQYMHSGDDPTLAPSSISLITNYDKQMSLSYGEHFSSFAREHLQQARAIITNPKTPGQKSQPHPTRSSSPCHDRPAHATSCLSRLPVPPSTQYTPAPQQHAVSSFPNYCAP